VSRKRGEIGPECIQVHPNMAGSLSEIHKKQSTRFMSEIRDPADWQHCSRDVGGMRNHNQPGRDAALQELRCLSEVHFTFRPDLDDRFPDSRILEGGNRAKDRVMIEPGANHPTSRGDQAKDRGIDRYCGVVLKRNATGIASDAQKTGEKLSAAEHHTSSGNRAAVT
jgi:hypothetical protein